MYPSCEQNFYHFSISIFLLFTSFFLLKEEEMTKAASTVEKTPRGVEDQAPVAEKVSKILCSLEKASGEVRGVAQLNGKHLTAER